MDGKVTAAASLAAVAASVGEPESEESKALRGSLVKALVAVVANVSVLTALLVYFGWIRSELYARYLGIDQAILGMTIDDYVRRSVEAVVVLPLVSAGAGLLWVTFDQWWRRRRRRRGADDRIVVLVARRMWVAAVVVFFLGIACWIIGTPVTYVAAPLVCAAGLLLLLYGLSLHGTLPGSTGFAPLTEAVLRGAIALLVAIGLFWSANNYARVQGTELAREFPNEVHALPNVEIDSDEPLSIVAPGVQTSCFTQGGSTRYHYRGLKYLESTGGNYFLISDGWTRQYGVVVILPASADGIRYTFVRDTSGTARDDHFPPCDLESSSSPTVPDADADVNAPPAP